VTSQRQLTVAVDRIRGQAYDLIDFPLVSSVRMINSLENCLSLFLLAVTMVIFFFMFM
jgi:hypothetical protein